MPFIDSATVYLEQFAMRVPVELFVFVGALVEEIIAPIPSPVIMTLGGSIAATQQKTLVFLLLLAVLGAVGKLIGSWLMYVVADKAEDLLITRFGKLLGVSHKELERLGQHFGKGNKDFLLIFLARVVPVMPTAPISVIAGLIKLPLKTYLTASFLGYIGRNLFYLYVGYVGYDSYKNVLSGLDSMESAMQVLIVGMLVGIIGYMYYKRGRTDVMSVLKRKLGLD